MKAVGFQTDYSKLVFLLNRWDFSGQKRHYSRIRLTFDNSTWSHNSSVFRCLLVSLQLFFPHLFGWIWSWPHTVTSLEGSFFFFFKYVYIYTVHTHTYIYIYVCVYIYMHIHTHTHIYIDKNIYIYICICGKSLLHIKKSARFVAFSDFRIF